jgi:hypothetical protein
LIKILLAATGRFHYLPVYFVTAPQIIVSSHKISTNAEAVTFSFFIPYFYPEFIEGIIQPAIRRQPAIPQMETDQYGFGKNYFSGWSR